MKSMVNELIKFETKLLEGVVLEESNIVRYMDRPTYNKFKNNLLCIVNESYSLLTPKEKKDRLSFLEGIVLKSKTLLQESGIGSNVLDQKDLNHYVAQEEFKSIMIRTLREDKNSYKLVKSPHHFKVMILDSYLIPKDVRQRVDETKDILLTEKVNALKKAITNLVVKYNPIQN